jgi:hypothetical protein
VVAEDQQVAFRRRFMAFIDTELADADANG